MCSLLKAMTNNDTTEKLCLSTCFLPQNIFSTKLVISLYITIILMNDRMHSAVWGSVMCIIC